MQQVKELIDDGTPKVIVLSAVAGTTNKLLEIARQARAGQIERATQLLGDLRDEYRHFVNALLQVGELRSKAHEAVARCLATIDQLLWGRHFGPGEEKITLAQGELLSTQIFQAYLLNQGIVGILLPALELVRLRPDGEPDLLHLRTQLETHLAAHPQTSYFITQGYICRNAQGEIDNLQRGGSDYTATLIGAALNAEEVQIWTDIDGLHNNDPRIVDHTTPIRQVSYREAAELAYFGAKILHPTCVIPAEEQQVPILLKNTFAPGAPGTLISAASSGRGVTAIAAKDGITAIRIQSARMLNAYGFLRKVFEVFETFRTPIDMITTSEVSVSLTVDNTAELAHIQTALAGLAEVTIDHDQSIICVVGDALYDHPTALSRIFAALSGIPVRMVSYGGSDNNISLLVAREFKEQALRQLHQELFRVRRPELA